MQTGFVRAAHAGWWILAGCGYIVLLLGLVCTTRWARATAARTAAMFGTSGPGTGGPGTGGPGTGEPRASGPLRLLPGDLPQGR